MLVTSRQDTESYKKDKIKVGLGSTPLHIAIYWRGSYLRDLGITDCHAQHAGLSLQLRYQVGHAGHVTLRAEDNPLLELRNLQHFATLQLTSPVRLDVSCDRIRACGSEVDRLGRQLSCFSSYERVVCQIKVPSKPRASSLTTETHLKSETIQNTIRPVLKVK